jgi:hypothetical protein
MGINYKGSQGQTERTAGLQEEEEEEEESCRATGQSPYAYNLNKFD